MVPRVGEPVRANLVARRLRRPLGPPVPSHLATLARRPVGAKLSRPGPEGYLGTDNGRRCWLCLVEVRVLYGQRQRICSLQGARQPLLQ